MKTISLAVAAVSAAAAVTTGFVSYEAFAPEETASADAASPAATPDQQRRRARWADCPKDTELRGRFCVRTEGRVVTEYVAASPAPVQQVAAPADPGVPPGPGDDSDDSDEGPDDHPDPDEDHFDDDHGDDHDDDRDEDHGDDDDDRDDDDHGDDDRDDDEDEDDDEDD